MGFAARRHAASRVIAQRHKKLSYFVPLLMTVQVVAFFQIVGFAAWLSNVYLTMPVPLLAAAALAAHRDKAWTAALRVPAKADKQMPACGQGAWVILQGVILMGVVVGAVYLARTSGWSDCNAAPLPGDDPERGCHSDGVPPGLPCDRVDAECYRQCVARQPWWVRGQCDADPVMLNLSEGPAFVLFPIFLLSMLSSLVWGLLVAVSSRCLGHGLLGSRPCHCSLQPSDGVPPWPPCDRVNARCHRSCVAGSPWWVAERVRRLASAGPAFSSCALGAYDLPFGWSWVSMLLGRSSR